MRILRMKDKTDSENCWWCIAEDLQHAKEISVRNNCVVHHDQAELIGDQTDDYLYQGGYADTKEMLEANVAGVAAVKITGEIRGDLVLQAIMEGRKPQQNPSWVVIDRGDTVYPIEDSV